MSDAVPEMVAPKFRITLTAAETLEVGRLSVVWGQIDHFVLCSVSMLLAKDLSAGVALLGTLTTGPLVNQLNKARVRIEDEEIQNLTKKFCEDMGPLIDKRNHLMHGIWGVHLPGKDPTKGKPACFFTKHSTKPLFPQEVTKLANDAARQTHHIVRIWHYLTGQSFPDGQHTYFFGSHEPTTPPGMRLVQIAQPPKGHRPPR